MDVIGKLLTRIFVAGFYRQYSGLFLLVGLLFIGMCPPGQYWEVFVGIALATVSKGWLLAITITFFSLYLFLALLFISGQFRQESHRFLRYSLGALSHLVMDRRWLLILCANSLPLLFFGSTAIIAGYLAGEPLLPSLLLLYIVTAFAACFWLILRFTEPLKWVDRAALSLDFGIKWGNSYTLLGLRQVMATQRVPYLLAKLLSYIFVNGLFFVYDDVKDHTGVVMLVLTAIVMGHATVIAGQFTFEREDLSLLRNLPHRKVVRGGQVALRLIVLLLPETVWLVARYPLPDAMQFLLYLWAFALVLYHLFFLLSPKEAYANWLFFLFLALAIGSPWGIMVPLIFVFLGISMAIYWVKG